MKILTLILIVIVSGCATTTIPVQTPLQPCPKSPELVGMGDYFEVWEAYAKKNLEIVKILNKRENQLVAHAKTLCGIIESTHK